MNKRSKNLVWHSGSITHEDRCRLLNQRGCVVWFTGLSGSGKSTIAHALEERLVNSGHLAYVLDGDNIRHGLNADLGFSPGERRENIRRVGELAALFADAGLITITAFISPYRADRDTVRRTAGKNNFIEIFLNVPLNICEQRDPKNFYKKARTGEITDFTGISAPYEAPSNPEITLDTSSIDVSTCVDEVMKYLEKIGYIERTARHIGRRQK